MKLVIKGLLRSKSHPPIFFFDNSVVKTDIKILVGRSGLFFHSFLLKGLGGFYGVTVYLFSI